MRYLIGIMLLLVISGCDMGRPEPELPMTWMPDPTLEIDNREVTSESVVFLGDSLTHIPIWQDFFPNVKTANQGIGGNTTFNVLKRLGDVTGPQPKTVFLLIGANDLNYGIPHEIITANQRKIIQRIKSESPKTKIYVQSILPFGRDVRVYFPNNVPKSFRNDIQAINTALVWVCNIERVTYLNVHEVMVDEDGYLKSQYTIDQVHLSEEGYRPWVDYIKPYVVDSK